MKQEKEQITLEDAFCEIERIIQQLESEEVSLKDSMELYRNGTTLLAKCREELNGIEKEMIIIGEHLNEQMEGQEQNGI